MQEDLTSEQLAQLLPAELTANANAAGIVGYDADGNVTVVEIRFIFEQEQGPMAITMTALSPTPMLRYAGEGNAEISHRNGTDFVLLHGRHERGRVLSAEATLNGIACSFTMMSGKYSTAEMKAVFETVLDAFAGIYLDLSAVHF